MDSELLAKQILRMLKLTFNRFSRPQLKNLSDVIVALFFNKSFALREIASKMPGESNVKHKLKRLVYFLDSFKLDDTFFKSYIKTLFALPSFRFRKRKYLTILLDFTTLLDDFLILSASISFKGRSIPVYIKVWKGVHEHYDYKGRVEEFIKHLSNLLPKQNYELIADRGFQGYDMIQIFKNSGWDYCVRLQKSYCVKEKSSPNYVQMSLFEDGFYEDVTVGKNRPTENVNLAVNSIKNEEGEKCTWYLLTSVKSKERAVNDYSRRMWIEETFKDLKGVLKWEQYTEKIPEKGRLEKMIVISCLSYAIQMSIGDRIDVPKSEEKKTSILKRFQNIISSSYRLVGKLFNTLTSLFIQNYQRSYFYLHNIFG